MAPKKENIELSDISLDNITYDISSLINKHVANGEKIDWHEQSQDEAHEKIDFSEPAPNIIEWSVNEKYLNLPSLYSYKRSYQVLRDLFNLRCPLCNPIGLKYYDCWDKGREYLESENLLVWSKQYNDDVCPKCKTTRSEFETDEVFKRYNTMVLCVGQRSGKSVLGGSYLSTYIEHRLITLGNPAAYFEVIPGQPFEVAFAATTATQAEGTIYAYYRAARSRSPWLQAYIEKLRAEERKKGLDKGILYSEKGDSVFYKNLNIEFNSLTSNSAGLAGRTRPFAIIDELSRFDLSLESKRAAREVYSVLENSLMTVRTKASRLKLPHFFGMMAVVSSPMFYNDLTMKLVRDAKKIRNIYAIHLPTWEFNPDVTREELEQKFQSDPIEAERSFGANPPMASSPLIQDVERFKAAINERLVPKAVFEDTYPIDGTGRAYVGKRLVNCNFDNNTVHYLCGDAGKSRDSFALVCAHGEYIEHIYPDGSRDMKWTTVFDWCLTIRPTNRPKRTVYFDCIVDIINNLRKRQKIQLVTFDHWNSESILQNLRNMQIEADVYCAKSEDYINFVNDAYEGKVQLISPIKDDDGKDPYINMSDYGRFLHEFLNLERGIDMKVDHRAGEHNDICVCAISAHRHIQSVMLTKGQTKNARQVLNLSAQNLHPKMARLNFWK